MGAEHISKTTINTALLTVLFNTIPGTVQRGNVVSWSPNNFSSIRCFSLLICSYIHIMLLYILCDAPLLAPCKGLLLQYTVYLVQRTTTTNSTTSLPGTVKCTQAATDCSTLTRSQALRMKVLIYVVHISCHTSATTTPRHASMDTRPCLISASRHFLMSAGAAESDNSSGSKICCCCSKSSHQKSKAREMLGIHSAHIAI